MAKEIYKIISNDVKLKTNKNNPSSERIINTFVNAHLYEKVVYEVINNFNNDSENESSKVEFKKISSLAHEFPTVDRLHNNLIELFKGTFVTVENLNKENVLVIKRLSMDPKLLIFVKYLYRLQDVFEPRKFMNTWWNTLFKPILLNSRWRDLIKVTQNIIIHFCLGNEIYKKTDIEDTIIEYQHLLLETYINEQKSIVGQLNKAKKIESRLYDTTFSANLENLIIKIGISKPKEIFHDLNEQFIGDNRFEVINILNKIATMEQFPVHLIVETDLFNSLLCSIAVDEYAPIVCGCLSVLTILIPRIFNHLPNILDQLFSLLIRTILWERKYVKIIKHYLEEIDLESQNKDYSLKEKHQNAILNNLMSLYSSQTLWNTVLNYFTFLYGMFPCNLLSFTKKLFEDFMFDSEKDEDIISNNEKLRKHIFKNLPFYSPEKDEIEGFKIANDVFSSIRYISKKSNSSDIHYLEQAFNIILENFLVHPNLMFSNSEKEKTDLSKWIQEDASVITISCLSLYRPLKLDKKAITTITNAAGYNNDDENASEISLLKHNSSESKILPTWNMTQLNMALSSVTPTHSRAWAHETASSRVTNDHFYSWKPIDDDLSEKFLDFNMEGGNNMIDMEKEIKKIPNFDTNIWDKVTTSNLSQRRKFTNMTQSHIDRRKVVPEDDLKYTEHYIKVHNFEKQATLDNFLSNNNNNDNSQTFGSYNSKEPTEIEQRFINPDSVENIYANSTVDDGFTKSVLNNKSSINNITVVSVTSNTDKQSLDDSIVSETKNDKSFNKSLSSIVTTGFNDIATSDEIAPNQPQTQKPKPPNGKFSTSTSIPGLNTSGNGITAQTSTTVMSSNLSAIHHYQSHGNIQSILQQKSISQIINEGNNNINSNNITNNNANNINANNTNSLINNIIPGIDPHLNSLTNDADIIINMFSELRTSLSSFFYSLKILSESDDNTKNPKDNNTKSNTNNSTLSSNTSINNTNSITAMNETMDNVNLQLDISKIHIFLLLNDLNYETYLRQSYLYSIRKLKKDLIAMEYKKNENLALLDKSRYQNQEIIYLQEQLDCQRVELHAIKDRYNSYQEGLTQQLYSLSKKNAEFVDTIARLKDHLLECENIINNQKNRLDQANEKIFQLENCINVIKPQINKQEEMEKQIEQLTKQLLLWEDDTEANETTLKQMEEMANQVYNLEMIISSYRKELSDVKLALTEKNHLNNTLLTKLANIERYNEKEENSKNEYTEVINRQRSLYDQQVQILEDKYQGVKQINLQLEMQIMNLQCELEKANLEVTKTKQVIERMNREKLESDDQSTSS